MVLRRRFALMVTAAVVAGIAATALTVTGSSAAPRPLASLLVRASQVGPGYRAHQETWAKSTGAQSVSCHHTRESGNLAVEAIGDEYAKAGANPQLFNVLLKYRTATETANNLALLRHILTTCPNLKIQAKSSGTTFTLTVSFTRLPTPHGLLPHSVALRQITIETGTPRPSQLIDVYQPDGNILSLTYAFGSNPRKLRALTTRVAQASAYKLG